MKIFKLILVGALVLVLTAMQSLQQEWDKEYENINQPEEAILANKQVIFVAGFLNELAELTVGYFSDSIEVAEKDFGAITSCICPSSKINVPDNAKIIYEQIINIYNKNKLPIILVGHSKGAAEIEYLLYTNPQLITNHIVEQALFIQSAILGSPLADRSDGCLLSMAIALLSPNVETLKTSVCILNYQEALRIFEEKLNKLSTNINTDKNILKNNIISRMVYLCTETNSPKLSMGLEIVLGVLQDNLSRDNLKHDGLMPIANQAHPDSLAFYLSNCDHAGPVLRKPLSNLSSKRRKALMRVGFKKLHELKLNYCNDF